MATFFSRNWHLDRRTFLRGAGVSLALPFLEVMQVPGHAVTPISRPRRLAFIYVPNGVNVKSWFPTEDGLKCRLSPSLQSLESLRAHLTVFSGLHHPNAYGAGHSVADTWLTGAKLTGTPGKDYQNSVSADQVAAEAYGPATRFPSLELSITGGTGKPGNLATLAITRTGVPLPAESSPKAAFARLFEEQPGGPAAQRRAARRRQSVLDAVGDNAKELTGRVSTADRAKLEEYLNTVRDVEVRIKRAVAWLDVPRPKVAGAEFQKQIPADAVKEYFRVVYDLMVLAFQTDSTRVVTYQAGQESTGLAFPEIGVHQLQHSLSHHQNDPENLAALAKIDAFQVEQFAYFLARLKETKEGEDTLLDRTLVLYGSGMSNGNAHAVVNLPILLAGGSALGVKHAGHLNFNTKGIKRDVPGEAGQKHEEIVNEKARLANLLLTMLRAAGVDVAAFADSTGAIKEILPA